MMSEAVQQRNFCVGCGNVGSEGPEIGDESGEIECRQVAGSCIRMGKWSLTCALVATVH